MSHMKLLRVWCLFFIASEVSADICNADIDYLLTKKYFLPGNVIWKAKTLDILNCARSCIRFGKSCESFNYNTRSSECQLNSKAEQPSRYDLNFVYSAIADWPSQIDPDCYDRPCGDHETCIPGGLMGGTSCSFTCLKRVLRCPVPEGTVSNEPRTVGSIFTHTCDPRLVGGDSALCLPTGQWNKTINTSCKPRYQSACEGDDYCSPINGTCSDNVCQCPNDTVYDEKELSCVRVLRCPVPEGTVSNEPRTVGSIFTHTCDPRLVGGDSALCLPTGQWNKTINTSCKPRYKSACEDGDYCSPINGTCDKVCHCPNGTVYDEEELSCVDCGLNWTPFQGHCYRIFMEEENIEKANKTCKAENSSLVVVETKDENDFLKSKMRAIAENEKEHLYWNSLYQVNPNNKTDVKWRTENGDLTPQFLDWGGNEPNKEDEPLTVFWSGNGYQWADVHSSKRARPVCEK